MRARWRCSSLRSSSRRRGLSSNCSTGGWSMADRAGRGGALGRWVAYALVLPLAILTIAPFLYMVAAALVSEPDSLRHPVPEAFAAALVALPVGRFLLNSLIFSLAVVAARPCHARCARVRRAVEELSLAARCHALDRDATGRGGHRESGGHVPCELVVPDGERGNGRHPADGAVLRGAEVFHSGH